jgi:phage FluMu protein Com
MGTIKCVNCDTELLAIDGSPCPKCGTIADKAKITEQFQTIRKVTAKAEYTAQTKRIVLNTLDYYKKHPKDMLWLIIGTVMISIMTVGLSLILDKYISNLWGIWLPNIIGCILAVVWSWIFRPKFPIGDEWDTWQETNKKSPI